MTHDVFSALLAGLFFGFLAGVSFAAIIVAAARKNGRMR
jgi:hypothetical protein